MEDFFYLGVITKPFGYKGMLSIYLDTDEVEKYSHLDAVFVDVNGEKIPYLIEEIQIRKGSNLATIKLADVDSEEAKNLVKCELYLPISFLPPLTGNKFYFHEVLGYKVIDNEKGEIGIIADFIEIAQQSIMQVNYQNKEILIPVIDDIFNTVDRENKIIHITAPEGLIDIYL